MWKNERKILIIRNVIIGLVLLAVAAGLQFMMTSVNKQIAAEDALLRQEHSSQRQELNDARQDSLVPIQQVYEHHKQVVSQYLPGIVCWGDSLTTGSSGNVSYPLTLQQLIDENLCDVYDLSYSVLNPENYTYLNWSDYKISVPVVNMGGGQESVATVLGRSGVVPYVVKSDFVIPADQESVTITLVSEDGKAVTPLMAGNAGVNPVSIAGVEGTLTRTVSNQYGKKASYQFTRLEAGEETPVAKGTEVLTASREDYQGYIHIVWLGTYGDYKNAETLVEETKALLERQTANTDRYLVIGPCTIKGTWTNIRTSSLDAIDSAMLQAFGSHYINLRKYLIEDGLRDAGMSATNTDTTTIRKGGVPDSFRSKASGADLNGVAYDLIGQLVYERMELLGYFDEVREELNLDKIVSK